ncbi:7313_t:CDS:2, partial [Ambispora gerdemannii]
MSWRPYLRWFVFYCWYQNIAFVNYLCTHSAQYVYRLSIREVERGIEESLRVEDTKKDLQNIWHILNNFWLVEILYSRPSPS